MRVRATRKPTPTTMKNSNNHIDTPFSGYCRGLLLSGNHTKISVAVTHSSSFSVPFSLKKKEQFLIF